MNEKNENATKSIAFRIDVNLVDDFRRTVKKSGFSQTYLIQNAMKKIIKDLKDEK